MLLTLTAVVSAQPPDNKFASPPDVRIGAGKAIGLVQNVSAVASGYRGGKESVQMLLERGAQVEPGGAQPTFFTSAAYLAAGAGEGETLQLLLDKGANPTAMLFSSGFSTAT